MTAGPSLHIARDSTGVDIDAAERALREAVPIAKLIYIEPDVRRAAVDSTPA